MVRHRRFEPVEHGFRFRLQLLYVDLDELEQGRLAEALGASRLWSVGGRTPVSFHREDHLGPADEPLRTSVERLVHARLGRGLRGPVRLLTSPRHLGLGFNPASFYFGFDATGRALDVLVAEVTNTPWRERHCYVLDLASTESDAAGAESAPRSARCDKDFHVSPFMELGMRYAWRVTPPGRSLTVSIRNEWRDRAPDARRQAGTPYFQADLAATRRELEPRALRSACLRHPAQTAHVLAAIHRQAFRLWRKRVAFVPHPARRWPRRLDDPALCAATAPTGLTRSEP
ncbi:MAG: DUF1365 domain-containing protein [Myxococcota bacterium]